MRCSLFSPQPHRAVNRQFGCCLPQQYNYYITYQLRGLGLSDCAYKLSKPRLQAHSNSLIQKCLQPILDSSLRIGQSDFHPTPTFALPARTLATTTPGSKLHLIPTTTKPQAGHA